MTQGKHTVPSELIKNGYKINVVIDSISAEEGWDLSEAFLSMTNNTTNPYSITNSAVWKKFANKNIQLFIYRVKDDAETKVYSCRATKQEIIQIPKDCSPFSNPIKAKLVENFVIDIIAQEIGLLELMTEIVSSKNEVKKKDGENG